jgi:hypothetical protein
MSSLYNMYIQFGEIWRLPSACALPPRRHCWTWLRLSVYWVRYDLWHGGSDCRSSYVCYVLFCFFEVLVVVASKLGLTPNTKLADIVICIKCIGQTHDIVTIVTSLVIKQVLVSFRNFIIKLIQLCMKHQFFLQYNVIHYNEIAHPLDIHTHGKLRSNTNVGMPCIHLAAMYTYIRHV